MIYLKKALFLNTSSYYIKRSIYSVNNFDFSRNISSVFLSRWNGVPILIFGRNVGLPVHPHRKTAVDIYIIIVYSDAGLYGQPGKEFLICFFSPLLDAHITVW